MNCKPCNCFPKNTIVCTTAGNWLWCCREFLFFDHNNFAFISSVKMIRGKGILCHIPCCLHISGLDSVYFWPMYWNNFSFNFWETSWEFSGIYRDCLELWKPFLFHNHTKGVIAAYHSLTVSKGRDSLYDVTSEYFFSLLLTLEYPWYCLWRDFIVSSAMDPTIVTFKYSIPLFIWVPLMLPLERPHYVECWGSNHSSIGSQTGFGSQQNCDELEEKLLVSCGTGRYTCWFAFACSRWII